MPVDIKIDLKNKIVYSKGYGEITGPDLLSHPEKLKNFPDFKPEFHHIFDLSSVEIFNVKTSFIYEIAKLRFFSDSSKKAVITNRQKLFSLIKIYELLTKRDKKKIRLFKKRKEACKWILSAEK